MSAELLTYDDYVTAGRAPEWWLAHAAGKRREAQRLRDRGFLDAADECEKAAAQSERTGMDLMTPALCAV